MKARAADIRRLFAVLVLVLTTPVIYVLVDTAIIDLMHTRIIPLIVLTSLAAQADVLTPVQRFFGIGGQFPDYEEAAVDGDFGIAEAPYSPADFDLGVQEILVERSGVSSIIFDFYTSVFRTDNAPSENVLTNEESWISSSTASLAWRPHLANGWFGDFGISEDFVRFDNNSAQAYENFSSRIGIYKNFPDLDDSILFIRYEYQRLTTGSLTDGNYNAQRIRVGVQKLLWVAPGKQFGGALSTAYEWSVKPQSLERNEISLDLYYRHAITDSIYSLATARGYYFDYDQGGREDWVTSLSLGLYWQVNRNLAANASIFYDRNDSNTGGVGSEYEAWTGGLGIGCQLIF